MILYIISFLVGICSLHFFSELPTFESSILTIAGLLLISFILTKLLQHIFSKNIIPENQWRFAKLKKAILVPSLIPLVKQFKWIMLAFVVGYSWMFWHIYLNLAKRLPENLDGNPIQVMGTIASIPEIGKDGARFEFEIKTTIPEVSWVNPGRVMLAYSKPYSKTRKNNRIKENNIENIHEIIKNEMKEGTEVGTTKINTLVKNEIKEEIKEKTIEIKEIKEAKETKCKPEDLKVGDEWQFWVKLKKPRAYSNPGSFDKEKYYFQNRLQAQGRILLKMPGRKKGIDCSPKKIASHWTVYPIHRLRSELYQKMKITLKNKRFGPLITALVLGIREGITEEQWAVFRDTGTAHLMAISGLHVGLVASVIYYMTQLIWRCLPQSFLMIPAAWAGACTAIMAAVIYAILAGFSVPTQRAVVMILLFMMTIIIRRIGNAWRNYFIALAIVLLIDPFCTLSMGFWLSFAAVAMMLYGLKGRLHPEGLWWKWGRAQWVVFLGLMPLSLASFNQLSLISPLANILAIPWVSFTVVPVALIATLILPFSERVGTVFLMGAEACFSVLWPVLHFFANISVATWVPAAFSKLALISAFIGTIILLVPRGFPVRFIGLIWLLPLFFQKPSYPAFGSARFTLLDVGQGLAAIVETSNHVLVFDTGPKLTEIINTGSRVVLPFLENRGIKKIDALVISHGDNDHIGGLGSILEKMNVGVILTSEISAINKVMTASNNLKISKTIKNSVYQSSVYQSPAYSLSSIPYIKNCYAGKRWHWDGVDFEMIHPDTTHDSADANTPKPKRNDHCCVLQVKVGKQKLLLTGDIEMRSEKKLLEKLKQKLASTILVVPHHGSCSSSTEDFIEAVNPAYAVIPVGYLNPYGHPKAEIVERYRKLKISVLDSIQDGAISFTLKNQLAVEPPQCYRSQYKHYWHWKF